METEPAQAKCIYRPWDLLEKIRAVFTMREMDEVPSKEVCAILAITDSYLWVMLHRARMALRECLEMNWFDTPAGGTV